MKYFLLIFLHCLLFIGNCFAQQPTLEWVRQYDGPDHLLEFSGGMAVDSLGYIYVVGSTQHSGAENQNFVTLKYSPAGVLIWSKEYNGPGSNSIDLGIAIAVDKAGNIYVTGVSEETGFLTYAYATIKYNNNGIQQWVQRYRGPGDVRNDVYAIALDDSANVYVTGRSQSSISGHDSSSTIKYNTSGVLQWVRRYPGVGNSIAVDGQGNSYITGGPYTIKFNTNGVSQWISRTDSLNTVGTKIKIDSQGNAYIIGQILSNTPGNAPDFFTIKYNNNGTVQWTAEYNGPGDSYDYCNDLAIDRTGNVYITGGSTGLGNSSAYATIKYNPLGIRQWVQRYDGPVSASGASGITLDSLANVYVTGRSQGNNSTDCTTLKYNTDGILLWVDRYDNSPGNDAGGVQIFADKLFNVYVLGSKFISSSEDILLLKYSQVVNVNINTQNIPYQYKLFQNYPNPFNPSTNIKYQITASPSPSKGGEQEVKLTIYDITGRKVTTLVNQNQRSGTYTVSWNADNLPSGTYFCKLAATGNGSEFTETKKIILVK